MEETKIGFFDSIFDFSLEKSYIYRKRERERERVHPFLLKKKDVIKRGRREYDDDDDNGESS